MVVQQKIDVYTTVDGKSALSGALFAGDGSLTFRYDSGYLENRNAYDLAPSLPRMAGRCSISATWGLFRIPLRTGGVGACSTAP